LTRDPVKLAWAAGFFEGEGCIFSASNGAYSVVLNVVNSDRDVLDNFKRIVGCGVISERRRVSLNRKVVYQWQAYSESAIKVFRALEPWLSDRRRARFALALSVREDYIAQATAGRLCVGCGSMFVPTWNSQVSRQKYCSARCGRLARKAHREDLLRLLDESTRAA